LYRVAIPRGLRAVMAQPAVATTTKFKNGFWMRPDYAL
jgi:hypothetical protein